MNCIYLLFIILNSCISERSTNAPENLGIFQFFSNKKADYFLNNRLYPSGNINIIEEIKNDPILKTKIFTNSKEKNLNLHTKIVKYYLDSIENYEKEKIIKSEENIFHIKNKIKDNKKAIDLKRLNSSPKILARYFKEYEDFLEDIQDKKAEKLIEIKRNKETENSNSIYESNDKNKFQEKILNKN